jgi:hypothetical protein
MNVCKFSYELWGYIVDLNVYTFVFNALLMYTFIFNALLMYADCEIDSIAHLHAEIRLLK